MNRFKKKICLGITIGQEVIRLAALSANELESPWPLELRSFPDLESLEGYWLDWLDNEYSVDRVGAVTYDIDDMGVLGWLAERNITMEELTIPTYTFHSQIQQFKVPMGFEVAYGQAMGCLLRARAMEFTDLIIAEAFKLETTLKTLAGQLECLRAALPHSHRCPF